VIPGRRRGNASQIFPDPGTWTSDPDKVSARESRINAPIILIAFTPGLIKISGSVYQNKL